MRVVFRADSGIEQGTGHVMRCLTLAEELMSRGHEVYFFTRPISIDWLRVAVEESGVNIRSCEPDEIPLPVIMELLPDWLVVDSYRIQANAISIAHQSLPVLAIIDGTNRSIEANLYLDQNLGAENLYRDQKLSDRYLAGSTFALVRRAILSVRRDEPSTLLADRPSILCFMGGTDPSGAGVEAARSLGKVLRDVLLTVIAPQHLHDSLKRLLSSSSHVRVLAPTLELPRLLAEADVVVSAAGTSAWDVCALGIPSVLVAVADNQQASLHEAVSRGLTLGIDLVADGNDAMDAVGDLVGSLISDGSLRARLSQASLSAFDGRGASRVAQRMEGAHGDTS